MAGDMSDGGFRDRDLVAGEQGYEVGYFARRHGISVGQARDLIDRVGNDRDALDKAAQRLNR